LRLRVFLYTREEMNLDSSSAHPEQESGPYATAELADALWAHLGVTLTWRLPYVLNKAVKDRDGVVQSHVSFRLSRACEKRHGLCHNVVVQGSRESNLNTLCLF
jgi:hypothetical protein